jgi:hypothetical protein
LKVKRSTDNRDSLSMTAMRDRWNLLGPLSLLGIDEVRTNGSNDETMKREPSRPAIFVTRQLLGETPRRNSFSKFEAVAPASRDA